VPEPLLFHLRSARDLADRHFAEPLDLDALAAAACVSKYHFLRCFAVWGGSRDAGQFRELAGARRAPRILW